MSHGGPLFPLGRLFATPGALKALEEARENALPYLTRHHRGDYGVVDAHDSKANEAAIKDGTRVFSAYLLANGTRLWIITEADRSCTTLLLPSEY